MSMQLQNLPIYQSFQDEVDLELYRKVRVALARQHHQTLCLDLPGLRDLRLLLERDAWICVDSLLDDLPVMAWTGFDNKAVFTRSESISCEMIYYHSQAAVIVDSILHSLRREMSALAHQPESRDDDNVIDMHLAR